MRLWNKWTPLKNAFKHVKKTKNVVGIRQDAVNLELVWMIVTLLAIQGLHGNDGYKQLLQFKAQKMFARIKHEVKNEINQVFQQLLLKIFISKAENFIAITSNAMHCFALISCMICTLEF